MKYMGSKARIAKQILPIILKNRAPEQYYVEPFIGGANMMVNVTGNRIGADALPELIALYQAIQNGWEPPEFINEFDYKYIRDHSKDLVLRAYVGFLFSFGSKFFASIARSERVKGGYDSLDKFNKTAKTQIDALRKPLIGVQLYRCDYSALRIPPKSIIYCDPPYRGTTAYKGTSFNHNLFYDWCRIQKAKGHTVFVSEYNMPKDFKPVYSVDIKCTLNNNIKATTTTEKLFTL